MQRRSSFVPTGADVTGASALPSSETRTIPARVEWQAACRGDETAVICDGRRMSYRELNSRANQLAHYLRKNGVGPEIFVGIYMERSIDTVVAILAVLKAGGAYLPIDLAYPRDRVGFMLGDSRAPVVLSEARLVESLPEFGGRVISLDSEWPRIALESTENPPASSDDQNAAYVIYTSGSTGKPKGVVVTHFNVIRLFDSTDPWYRFDQHDVWTLFHSFAFDFSVWELWGALFYGGRVVVVPYLISRSPESFYQLLAAEGVTVLNQTPSAFRQLIWAEEQAAERLSLSLRYVIFGGEALELQSLRPWFKRHGDRSPQLVNMYGITETTVHVTYRPITNADLEKNLGSVIGIPIPDLTLHLLDEKGGPVPVGTAGELYVGGAGVARGYLNRPELTDEKFVTMTVNDSSPSRLYRSGDLARFNPDGELEYLGRVDHQVKIRGFRIELGEIENALNSHPQLRESIVIADGPVTGEKRLIAYVVASLGSPSVEELRHFLSGRLPHYMVPAVFVFLESLPLTINGKVDRRALPSPERVRPNLGREYVAPVTREEGILCEIWQEALQLDRVGLHDNFFELGGDSIRSIQVLSRAQEKGIRFSLQTLFEHPTVFELVRLTGADNEDAIPADLPAFSLISETDRRRLPEGIEEAYPAAKLQTGMVFHSDYDPESAIFHDVFSFRLRLPFEEGTLRRAIERLVERHAIFRTSLDLAGYSEPLQLVHRRVEAPFSVEDLRNLAETEQTRRLVDWVEREKRRRFDWKKAPLMRLHVQRYGDGVFQFIVSFHHVIMDGWSLAAMLTELFQDYAGLLEGVEKQIPPPRVTYRDFVVLERRAIESRAVQDYWRKKLENPTIQNLPRWPRSIKKGGKEQVRGPEIYFPDDVYDRLKKLAAAQGVPIRTVLLAAHCRVMSFLTGQSDLLTGLVANGRPQAVDGERLIGLFLNTLPFRMDLSGGTWRELVGQVFRTERELIPARRAPLAEIQQWTGGKPLFETTFDFVQFHVYRDLPGYKENSFLEDHYFEANNFKFFTTFMLDADAARLQMHFDYDPNEFPEEQIRLICDYYAKTLEAMATEPDGRYEQHSPLPESERNRLFHQEQGVIRPPGHERINDMIEEQMAKTPDAVAARFEDQAWTYRELNQRANFLAEELILRGAKPGIRIGIFCDRSLEMLTAVLAVLKSGGAYVPLDPAFPAERLKFMVEDAALELILANREPETPFGPRTLAIAPFLARSTPDVPKNPRSAASAESAAYLIYTSGSTGKPKGVEVPHRAVVNFLESMQEQPGIASGDRLLALTTLSFDISILELLLPLTVGAEVVIARSRAILDPEQLARTIELRNITLMQATPTTWKALLESGWKGNRGLKALCGGELLTREIADKLLERTKELWNLYGPTETAIWSSCEQVNADEAAISIGKPIANTQILFLDAHLKPVATGCEGEIFIGGKGLAHGYFRRPELTAEKFPSHPFDSTPGARLYRTGDLGRRDPDGRIYCSGRIDQQIKLRGFRIELGEIEAVLNQHPAIAASVVAARENAGGQKILAAYWIARGEAASVTALRSFLEERLPDYMVPSAFVQIDEIPLTPNGKVDRKRLPDPGEARPELAREFISARTPLEELLAQIWADVLKLERVGVRDNFFELGGHSLSAMRVIARLRVELETDLTIGSFFDHPTIEQFALYLMEEMMKQGGLSDEELGGSAGAGKETNLPAKTEGARTA